MSFSSTKSIHSLQISPSISPSSSFECDIKDNVYEEEPLLGDWDDIYLYQTYLRRSHTRSTESSDSELPSNQQLDKEIQRLHSSSTNIYKLKSNQTQTVHILKEKINKIQRKRSRQLQKSKYFKPRPKPSQLEKDRKRKRKRKRSNKKKQIKSKSTPNDIEIVADLDLSKQDHMHYSYQETKILTGKRTDFTYLAYINVDEMSIFDINIHSLILKKKFKKVNKKRKKWACGINIYALGKSVWIEENGALFCDKKCIQRDGLLIKNDTEIRFIVSWCAGILYVKVLVSRYGVFFNKYKTIVVPLAKKYDGRNKFNVDVFVAHIQGEYYGNYMITRK